MMKVLLTRRAFLWAPALALPVPAWGRTSRVEAEAQLAKLESKSGGRLGVAAIDTGSGTRIAHRADERFPLLSTFKFLAAALVLSRIDAGQEHLERRVRYDENDLVEYSPATEKYVADGMTVGEICEAALTLSDNTAGNLLLASFGGPKALTDYARKLGDGITRLDRIEPELNEVAPGDPRDTTTPAAMLSLMQRLLIGDALSPVSRDRLFGWLIANQTGDKRLRAGMPGGWRVGDKTGTSDTCANDIAIAWPPGRPPLLIACYLDGATVPPGARNAVHAGVGRIATAFA